MTDKCKHGTQIGQVPESFIESATSEETAEMIRAGELRFVCPLCDLEKRRRRLTEISEEKQ